MKIEVLWFSDAILLTKGCVPTRSLANGENINGAVATISLYDEQFLNIDYKHKDPQKDYCELVPLARVDKVIYAKGKSKSATTAG